MYTQKRNGQAYNLLPIEPPQPPPSSFYHYHYPYPGDPSAPPPDTPVVVQSSVLTATSKLSFDIFQTDNKSHHTIKLKTKDSERTQLLREEEERKKKAPFNFRFIYLVTIVEIILFGVSILKNHGFESFSVNPMIGPSAQVLLELGASDDELILNNGQWWRFITPIFLHAGLIHLVFNLIFQLQQGIPLEREFGSFRILPLYIVSGVVGNLMSCIFLPTIMSVGASGSLFGLMGAMLAAMLKNWKSLRRPCVGIVFLSLIISFNLFIGLLPHIDNFAHVGGLLAGFLYGLALIPSYKSSFTNGALACFGFMTASVGIGAGFFLFYTRFDMNNWCTWCKYIDCLPVLGWCNGY